MNPKWEYWIRNEAPIEYLHGWAKHFERHPPTAIINNYGLAQITAMVLNVTPKKSQSKIYNTKDFVLGYTKTKSPDVDASIADTLEAMAVR